MGVPSKEIPGHEANTLKGRDFSGGGGRLHDLKAGEGLFGFFTDCKNACRKSTIRKTAGPICASRKLPFPSASFKAARRKIRFFDRLLGALG